MPSLNRTKDPEDVLYSDVLPPTQTTVPCKGFTLLRSSAMSEFLLVLLEPNPSGLSLDESTGTKLGVRFIFMPFIGSFITAVAVVSFFDKLCILFPLSAFKVPCDCLRAENILAIAFRFLGVQASDFGSRGSDSLGFCPDPRIKRIS